MASVVGRIAGSEDDRADWMMPCRLSKGTGIASFTCLNKERMHHCIPSANSTNELLSWNNPICNCSFGIER